MKKLNKNGNLNKIKKMEEIQRINKNLKKTSKEERILNKRSYHNKIKKLYPKKLKYKET